MEEGNSSNNSANAKPLSPKSSRKHRLVADARWRANMYVCYALLKYSSLNIHPAVKSKTGKITRIAALQQALSQVQVLEEKVSGLVKEKNITFGTTETMKSVKEDFISITEEAIQSYLDRKKARETARLYDMDYNALLPAKEVGEDDLAIDEKTDGVYRSVSRSSLAPSYISDISSTIDGFQSQSHSPTTSTQVDHANGEENKETMQLNNSIHQQQVTDRFLLDTLLDDSDVLDLEVLQQMGKSPVNFSNTSSTTPKARNKSPSEALLIKTPKCRRLFCDRDQVESIILQPKSEAKKSIGSTNQDWVDSYSNEEDIVVPELTQTTQNEEYLSALSGDLEFYGESPQGSKYLSSQSGDPLVSAVNQLSRPVLKPTTCYSPDSQTVSPWKSHGDTGLESYQILP